MVSGAAWRRPLVSCAPCSFRLTFRFSSFKPNNVAYITANRLNFTVVELASVYLWHLWPLCLKWISVSVGTVLHVVSGRSRVSYSPREFKAIRTSMPGTRLATEVSECIISLGIRKPNRSKRAGHRRKCRNRSEADSINRGPWNVKNSNQSKEAEQGQQDVRSPASIPSVIYANIRSVTSKIDELQAVVSTNNPYIVCLTEIWLNSNIPNSACDFTDFICYRNDRQSAMGGGVSDRRHRNRARHIHPTGIYNDRRDC